VSDAVAQAVAALHGGELAVVPTDTVYGLAATAYRSEPARRLYELKGRDPSQPTALLAASVDLVFECVPEARGRAGPALRSLLPGPFTLVVPNPSRRFSWLCGSRPEAIGVRVPDVAGVARALLDGVGAIAGTSANLPGGPDPRSLAEVPAEILAAVAASLDGGELPGVPSTVVDLTGREPRILREGAVAAADVLARL
jgi:tRNA threonylcarbamoyl adenosine modification protein (Sua5/YciO/YrdC/YwlC family)